MRAFISLIVVFALAGGGWFAYSKYSKRPSDDDFITTVADRGPIVATVAATGTVEPITKVLVGSQVSGTVVKWYADFNQAVKREEVLLELDPDRFKRELEQQTAAVKVAEARLLEAEVRLKDATRERKRIQALFERKAGSENEFYVAQAAEGAADATVKAAAAELDAAKAAKSAAAVDLSRTIIRAPIDGVVISRDVDAGQTVAASLQAPTLFTIAADLRRMQVNANVAESDVGRIREGMPVEFRVDAYPERRFVGKVSQVRFNPTTVDNIVTYVTIVDVDNSELLLRPGMTANVTFEVAKVADALRVPNQALRFSPEGPGATQIGRPPSGEAGGLRGPRVYQLLQGRLSEIPLIVGLTDGSFTEVRGGELARGAKIVIDRRWTGGGPSSPRPGPQRMMRNL